MWCIAIRRMTARFPVITLTASLKMTSITASVLEHRSSEGHPVIVSNSDTSLIRSLYRNFTHHYIKAKRSIGVATGESKSATEIIAVSGARCWVGFDPSRGVDSSAVYGVRA